MLKRIAIYLQEMFPITAILGTVASAVSVQLVYFRLYDIRPAFELRLLFPGLVLTFISLLLRIMDEFKDYEDDLRNFPMRPLPSGKVRKSDLATLAAICVVMALFLSSGTTELFLASVGILFFTGLMFKWFFIEDVMRKNLPLAFITHHPVVFLNYLYLILACVQMDSRVGLEQWVYILPICLMYTNWELVRKIRAPEQETGYTTYSKIFGPRPAILISFLLQIAFNGSVLFVFHRLDSSIFLRVAFVVLQLILLWPSLRFLFNLKLEKPLKQNAEGQILVVVGFLLAAALL